MSDADRAEAARIAALNPPLPPTALRKVTGISPYRNPHSPSFLPGEATIGDIQSSLVNMFLSGLGIQTGGMPSIGRPHGSRPRPTSGGGGADARVDRVVQAVRKMTAKGELDPAFAAFPETIQRATGASSRIAAKAARELSRLAAPSADRPVPVAPVTASTKLQAGDFVEVRIGPNQWMPAKVRDVDPVSGEVWVFHRRPERYEVGGSETFNAADVRLMGPVR